MLWRLQTKDVGPVREMDLSLGSRLNVFTGDNGLGKSFVLDLIWWVLTGSWAGQTAIPSGGTPSLSYEGSPSENVTASFRFETQTWSWNGTRRPRGSVIYLGADQMAAFVLYRNAFVFEGRELWDGKSDPSGRSVCNGLVRDWVIWMHTQPGSSPAPFQVLEHVLSALSPDERERLVPGPPRRVTIDDSREIPTLVTPWEPMPVPVTLASAGVRRVLELAYMLVWVWHEHRQIAELLRQPPQEELFILVDEPEAHLHPRWQRRILPALMAIAEVLDPSLKLQLFITTHSPLVLASGEPLVNPARDRLFHFDDRGDEVHVDALDWIPELERPSEGGWLYLVERDHSWQRQMSIKGKRLLAATVWRDMLTNRLSAAEAAEEWDIPVEAVEEAVRWCTSHRDLLDMEAREEARRLSAHCANSRSVTITDPERSSAVISSSSASSEPRSSAGA